MRNYLLTVGDASSQLLNAVVFNSGNANESLSGRCWRQREHWFFGNLRHAIDTGALVFGDTNHCVSAYRNDVERATKLLQYYPNRNPL